MVSWGRRIVSSADPRRNNSRPNARDSNRLGVGHWTRGSAIDRPAVRPPRATGAAALFTLSTGRRREPTAFGGRLMKVAQLKAPFRVVLNPDQGSQSWAVETSLADING